MRVVTLLMSLLLLASVQVGTAAAGPAPPRAPERARATEWLARGDKMLSAGDLNGALLAWTRALQLDPRLSKAWLHRADAHRRKGQWALAISDYNHALALEPKNAEAWFQLAECRRQAADLSTAIFDYDHSLRLDPLRAAAWRGRASARRFTDHLDGALADFDKAIELDPTCAAAYNERASLELDMGRLDAAVSDATRAIEAPMDPVCWAYYNRAIAHRRKGDEEAALLDFDRAIALDPRDSAFYSARLKIWLSRGELGKATEDADRAVALAPESAYALFSRGLVRSARKSWRPAAEDFTQALHKQDDPDDPSYPLWAYIGRARTDHATSAALDLKKLLSHRRPTSAINRTSWCTALISFMAGQTSKKALLSRAAEGHAPWRVRQQLCSAWFYVGCKEQLRGHDDKARQCFEQTLATGAREQEEYFFAQLELARMPKKP